MTDDPNSDLFPDHRKDAGTSPGTMEYVGQLVYFRKNDWI